MHWRGGPAPPHRAGRAAYSRCARGPGRTHTRPAHDQAAVRGPGGSRSGDHQQWQRRASATGAATPLRNARTPCRLRARRGRTPSNPCEPRPPRAGCAGLPQRGSRPRSAAALLLASPRRARRSSQELITPSHQEQHSQSRRTPNRGQGSLPRRHQPTTRSAG